MNHGGSMDSHKFAQLCALELNKKLAENIKILDVRELTDITDYLVFASANGQPHLKALTESLDELIDNAGVALHHIEGLKGLSWVVVDAYDTIVHIFLPNVRDYYDLESYWGDAPIEVVSVD
jgi:ribosome-associated protein